MGWHSGPHQVQALERLRRQGEANGVADLALLSTRQVQKMEPLVRCDAAIFSPSTGIVDSHALLLALQGKAEAHGTEDSTQEQCCIEVSAWPSDLKATCLTASMYAK